MLAGSEEEFMRANMTKTIGYFIRTRFKLSPMMASPIKQLTADELRHVSGGQSKPILAASTIPVDFDYGTD
jgi:bacteriocin-like protein